MPFVDLGKGFEDVKEAELAPEAEYDLIIRDAKHDTEKGMINVMVDFEGEDYKMMYHTLWLPDPERDAETDEKYNNEKGSALKNKQLKIKRFCHAFEVPITENGFDVDDLKGATSRRKVIQDTYETKDGSVNRQNKVVIPTLPGE